MNDAVDRLIAERARLDRGFPVTALVSLFGHIMLAASVLVIPRLLPHDPPLRVADGFAIVLPAAAAARPRRRPRRPTRRSRGRLRSRRRRRPRR